MGWNSWYTHYAKVTDKVIRQAVDAMIATGMAEFGYEFISIDHCWARKANADDPRQRGETRDAGGNILPNDDFPDMKALTDYIHVAVGMFNLTQAPRELACRLGEVGARVKAKVRDVWRQKEDGEVSGELRRTVGPHGVTLVGLRGSAAND